MFNALFGIHMGEKFGANPDVIVFNESVSASGSLTIQLLNAINGSAQSNELKSKDYILISITLESTNGLVNVTLLPDAELTKKLKITATTNESTITPLIPILMTSGIEITLDNLTAVADDVKIIINCIKIPQNNTPHLYDYATTIGDALPNMDIQTLGTQTFIAFSNALLIALILANDGQVPPQPTSVAGASMTLAAKEDTSLKCGKV